MIEPEVLAGQLMVVGFDGVEPPQWLARRVATGRLGGVIWFARNVGSIVELAQTTRQLIASAPAEWPLLAAIDQEGGRVQRVRAPLACWPPMRRLGQLDDPALTEAVGQAIGRDLALLGFNLDFAPVLDVVESAQNTVIGDRSFGDDPQGVARHGLALARGLEGAGVLPCGKHFPGHGGPVADSHHALPVERRGREVLEQVDLVPFRAAIAAGLPLLMSAHVTYQALDRGAVGTLSRAICHDLLRERLGFTGALISDDLEMAAVAEHQAPGEAALAALLGGVDLILTCREGERQEAIYQTLVRAARAGGELRQRMEQALQRVSTLKRRARPPAPIGDPRTLAERLDAAVHADLLQRLSG